MYYYLVGVVACVLPPYGVGEIKLSMCLVVFLLLFE